MPPITFSRKSSEFVFILCFTVRLRLYFRQTRNRMYDHAHNTTFHSGTRNAEGNLRSHQYNVRRETAISYQKRLPIASAIPSFEKNPSFGSFCFGSSKSISSTTEEASFSSFANTVTWFRLATSSRTSSSTAPQRSSNCSCVKVHFADFSSSFMADISQQPERS